MANHKFKNRTHHISFKLAFRGLFYAFSSQPNFLIIGLFAFLALILSLVLEINFLEFIIVIWTIFIVFMAEMINTSLESITDLITKEWREDAKIAKDVSSGMVLLTVIGAALVGLIIFLPRILTLK